jgi:hypothetical protein
LGFRPLTKAASRRPHKDKFAATDAATWTPVRRPIPPSISAPVSTGLRDRGNPRGSTYALSQPRTTYYWRRRFDGTNTYKARSGLSPRSADQDHRSDLIIGGRSMQVAAQGLVSPAVQRAPMARRDPGRCLRQVRSQVERGTWRSTESSTTSGIT